MFGELRFESSRAFADDEDEDTTNEALFGVSVEWTEVGKKFLKGPEHPFVFCAFDGKVALGFGEGYLSQKERFTLLGQVFVTGNDGTVDLCSFRPRRKPIVRLFVGERDVVFALIDFYGVPRFLANDVVNAMLPLIHAASETVIFHSEIAAYHRSDREGECLGKLFYLTSTDFPARNFLSSLEHAERLQPPNIVGGPSAGILTQCERLHKPGLLLITYAETELVDSISLSPFFQAVSPSVKTMGSGENIDFDLAKLFSKYQHSIPPIVDVSNLYA